MIGGETGAACLIRIQGLNLINMNTEQRQDCRRENAERAGLILAVCNEHRARLAKRLQLSSCYAKLNHDGQSKIVYNGCMCVCCR